MTSGTLPPAPFGRVLTAMVTAFHDDGSVDLEATARVAEHLADHGHDRVVVSGDGGAATTTEEDGRILAAVVEAVGDRVKVIAGIGTNNTSHSVEVAAPAEKVGAHGASCVTPYYNKPSQAGIGRLRGRGRRRRPSRDGLRHPGPLQRPDPAGNHDPRSRTTRTSLPSRTPWPTFPRRPGHGQHRP